MPYRPSLTGGETAAEAEDYEEEMIELNSKSSEFIIRRKSETGSLHIMAPDSTKKTQQPPPKTSLTSSIGLTPKLTEQRKGICGLACCRRRDKRLPNSTKFRDAQDSVVFQIKYTKHKVSTDEDWSAAVEVEFDGTYIFRVHKFIDNVNIWLCSYKLLHPVDSLDLLLLDKANTCVITLKKSEVNVWKTFGTPNPLNNHILLDASEDTELNQAFIVYKQALTSDVNFYGIRLRRGHYGVHIGHHVYMQVGGGSKNPYTPVCFTILPEKRMSSLLPGNGPILWFIIKTYSEGSLSDDLDKIPVVKFQNDSFDAPIKLSFPYGIFDIKFIIPDSMDLLLLFAAGTGITPLIRIIENVVVRNQNGSSKTKIVLFFWNKVESGVIWKRQFQDLQSKENWFKLVNIFTKAPASWKGYSGRPSVPLIRTMLDELPPTFSSSTGTHVAVCGSSGFNESVDRITSELLGKENIFVFD